MAKHVAFYWVSDGAVAEPSAALEAQRKLARGYARGSGKPIDEVHASDRTVARSLQRAIRAARRYHTALLIPRMRALTRRPDLLRCLIGHDVEVVALDGRDPERFTHRDLTVALRRWMEFSPRVKSGLQRAKARGARLGNPNIKAVQIKGTLIAKENAKRVMQNPQLLKEVNMLRNNGLSLRGIANKLNQEGIPTARGGLWHASTIRNILKEVAD